MKPGLICGNLRRDQNTQKNRGRMKTGKPNFAFWFCRLLAIAFGAMGGFLVYAAVADGGCMFLGAIYWGSHFLIGASALEIMARGIKGAS